MVLVEEGSVSELDRGSVMGFVGKDDAAYGYHVVSTGSGLSRVAVSLVIGRRRTG